VIATLGYAAAPLVPLALGIAALWARPAALVARLMPWCALPALALALWPPAEPFELSWLLLGTELAVDDLARPLLALVAVIWTGAGLAARVQVRERPRLFAAFWGLSAAGTVTVPIAADLVTFYLAFGLMTFAAYGLVVHDRTDAALFAGRVYVVMSVIGEALLLAALLLAAVAAGGTDLGVVPEAIATSGDRDLIIALLIGGFGLKLGLLGLHMWLPLAHPVAPAGASAVLSGAMVAAGLIGWMRFMPGGAASLEGVGALLVGLGIAGALLAALAGTTQRDLKTALAYSTVSQMGLIAAVLGLGLAHQIAWEAAVGVGTFYLLAHGLAKAALFVAAGELGATAGRGRLGLLVGFTLAAVVIAGAPGTAGSLAKDGAEGLADAVPLGWSGTVGWALSASAVTTALLLGHALRLAIATPPGQRRGGGPVWPAPAGFAALAAAALLAPAWIPGLTGLDLPASAAVDAGMLWSSLWPIVLAAAIGGTLLRLPVTAPLLPPGDVIVPMLRAGAAIARRARRLALAASAARGRLAGVLSPARQGPVELGAGADRLEAAMGRWPVAAAAFALLILVLAAVLR
jgi:formate hydrogenlyase subunit 3/multisubunit Na+/H+ antiporter MnhD subunit